MNVVSAPRVSRAVAAVNSLALDAGLYVVVERLLQTTESDAASMTVPEKPDPNRVDVARSDSLSAIRRSAWVVSTVCQARLGVAVMRVGAFGAVGARLFEDGVG